MITLTINPETESEQRSFSKDVVIIGAESLPSVDLALPGENLQSIHVKIIREGDHWFIFNTANDPFVTLNSLPFSKKKLNTADLIQIGKTFIRFDGSVQKVETKPSFLPLEKAEDALERTLSNVQFVQSDNKPAELGMQPEDQDDMLWLEVEALAQATDEKQANEIAIKKVEKSFQQQIFAPVQVPIAQPTLPVQPAPQKMEQDDLLYSGHSGLHFESRVYDLDEDPPLSSAEKEKARTTEELQGRLLNWNLFFLAFVAIVLVATLIAGGVYVSMADKREAEKVAASEGVADVAMALLYAQVNHIKPQKQNWSDTDFLKNNLSSILSPEYPSFANLDSLGQFTNCPYICRIYTSSDLSQFLVIAQPEPSLLQWLLPKTAIVVDSREMELRTLEDLKLLNRLLLSPTTLDGMSSREISNLVKQGSLIPLTYLSSKQRNSEFAPPKALALIRPGSENRIYNAPRYYPFGESVLKKTVSLLESTANSYEVTRVKQELTELSRFSNFVLYSSQGMQKAIQAQKALSIILPQHQFLTAYLNFNKEGVLTSSHLLIDEQSSVDPIHDEKEVALATPEEILKKPPLHSSNTDLADARIDRNHPLFLQLFILAITRQQALKPVSEKIELLLKENAEKGVPEFSYQFATLLEEYERIDHEQHDNVREGLIRLYQEYSHLSLADYTHYVKAAGLDQFAKENLSKRSDEIGQRGLSDQQIADQLHKIQNSKNFASLEHNVQETVSMLTLLNLPNPDLLMRHQNEMRVLALQQLRKLILSSDQSLPLETFTEENRAILTRILQAAWVNDAEEYDYYLHEFELRDPSHEHSSP
jgi:hypothetical protein